MRSHRELKSCIVALPVAALLVLAFPARAAEPLFAKTEALPGACMCDMAYCCSGAAEGTGGSPCEILSGFAPLTSGEDVEGFCAPYLDGTLDNSTLVCDAILADEAYSSRFVGGDESSVWLGVEAFLKCEDLELSTCPAPVTGQKEVPEWGQYVIDGWASYNSNDPCHSFSRQLDLMFPGLSLVAHAGCVAPPDSTTVVDYEVFAMYNEVVATSDVDDLQECPVFADGVFTDATASGTGNVRWQCYDLYQPEKAFNGTILINETTARFMYFSLGRLPCSEDGGDTGAGVVPPGPGQDSAAGRNNFASALALFVHALSAVLLLGLSLL